MNFAANDGLFATGLNPSEFDLPHPRLDQRVVLLVHKVFIQAFVVLRKRCSDAKLCLAELKEDQITVALRGIIESDFRQKGTAVLGFDKRRFETVDRQIEVESHDLRSVSKKPDMLFRLRSDEESPRILSTQDGLFVECKPVDSEHPAGGDYCDAGLIRFVQGIYAWAMQDALMVGYVRDNRSLQKHLRPALAARPALHMKGDLERIVDEGDVDEHLSEPLQVSLHDRPIDWLGGKGRACPIYIYHSWHQAT